MKGKKRYIFGILGAAALCAAAYFVYESFVYVSTDDAQVQAHVTMLSSRVAGTIQKVLVEENQKVKAGDVLAQIDTSDYSSASEAARAQVAALDARLKEAQANYERAEGLYKEKAISRARYDAAQASYRDLSARLKASQAQLEQANLNVSYTKIVAPENGMIARKSVEPGQFVPAGQPLFGFVASKERWVVANLKETEIDRVFPGRPAEVDVDAISGKTFHGTVESLSPSTGAVFSLLPPDNATGNFTKVVQRVPVRIRLNDITDQDVDLLRAGLSANVSIRIR